MTLRRVKPPGPGDPLGTRAWPRRPSIGWLLLALMGVAIDPNSVLSLPRDADRGRRISFAGSASSCQGCHSIEGRGTEVGPDLSKIGAKYAKPELLMHILQLACRVGLKDRPAELLATDHGRPARHRAQLREGRGGGRGDVP